MVLTLYSSPFFVPLNAIFADAARSWSVAADMTTCTCTQNVLVKVPSDQTSHLRRSLCTSSLGNPWNVVLWFPHVAIRREDNRVSVLFRRFGRARLDTR